MVALHLPKCALLISLDVFSPDFSEVRICKAGKPRVGGRFCPSIVPTSPCGRLWAPNYSKLDEGAGVWRRLSQGAGGPCGSGGGRGRRCETRGVGARGCEAVCWLRGGVGRRGEKAAMDVALFQAHSLKSTDAARHTLRLPACLSPTPLAAGPNPPLRPPRHAPRHLVSPRPAPPHPLLLSGEKSPKSLFLQPPPTPSSPPDTATTSMPSVHTQTRRSPAGVFAAQMQRASRGWPAVSICRS